LILFAGTALLHDHGCPWRTPNWGPASLKLNHGAALLHAAEAPQVNWFDRVLLSYASFGWLVAGGWADLA